MKRFPPTMQISEHYSSTRLRPIRRWITSGWRCLWCLVFLNHPILVKTASICYLWCNPPLHTANSDSHLTCDCESCTMSLATSWSTSIILRMVAPSLVTVTSLSEDTIILSRPLGPREVRNVLATVLAACMCDWNKKLWGIWSQMPFKAQSDVK